MLFLDCAYHYMYDLEHIFVQYDIGYDKSEDDMYLDEPILEDTTFYEFETRDDE